MPDQAFTRNRLYTSPPLGFGPAPQPQGPYPSSPPGGYKGLSVSHQMHLNHQRLHAGSPQARQGSISSFNAAQKRGRQSPQPGPDKRLRAEDGPPSPKSPFHKIPGQHNTPPVVTVAYLPADNLWLGSIEMGILAARLRVTLEERVLRAIAFKELQRVVTEVLGPRARCLVFGSCATKMDWHGSDVDVAILGMFRVDGKNGGFSNNTSIDVGNTLEAFLHRAELDAGLQVVDHQLVKGGRIPHLVLHLASGVTLDVSFNEPSVQTAAQLVMEYAARLPHLGDLVRVAKVLLKEWELDKVFTGGLSSWNVVQLAICHLLEKEVVVKRDHGGNWAAFTLYDLVLSFLRRYGALKLKKQAVSVREGTITDRWRVERRQQDNRIFNKNMRDNRLMVEDMLTGRESASGSHLIKDILDKFAEKAERLEASRRDAATPEGAARRAAARAAHLAQGGGDVHDDFYPVTTVEGVTYQHMPLLMDVRRAVVRAPAAQQQAAGDAEAAAPAAAAEAVAAGPQQPAADP